MRRFVLALAVLAVAAPALAQAPRGASVPEPGSMGRTPVAVGAPLFAQLLSVSGLPADSTVKEQFMAGLRDVFASDRLPSELEGGDGWRANVALPNRFHLLEGSPADDVYDLRLVIGAPAPAVAARRTGDGDGTKRRQEKSRRASRGMIVSVTVSSPEAREKKLTPAPVTVAFAFPAPPVAADVSQPVTSSGYTYSWTEAGRRAGLLALEALHREAKELRANERFDLAPAVRTTTGR